MTELWRCRVGFHAYTCLHYFCDIFLDHHNDKHTPHEYHGISYRTSIIMFRLVFALLFILGSFPRAHSSCSRSSSQADICCADGASHTFGPGVGAAAICRITEVTSASDCPPGWTFNEDGDKSNCQRALSTADGEGSGESTTLNVSTLNVCPNGNRAHVGVAPSPCGDYGAVASLCCVDPGFELPAGASVDFLCKAQKEGTISEAECPGGWYHQPTHNQCFSMAQKINTLSHCSAPLLSAPPPPGLTPSSSSSTPRNFFALVTILAIMQVA